MAKCDPGDRPGPRQQLLPDSLFFFSKHCWELLGWEQSWAQETL